MADVPLSEDEMTQLLRASLGVPATHGSVPILDAIDKRTRECDVPDDPLLAELSGGKHRHRSGVPARHVIKQVAQRDQMQQMQNFFGTGAGASTGTGGVQLSDDSTQAEVFFDNTLRRAMKDLDDDERMFLLVAVWAGIAASMLVCTWFSVCCCMCVCGYDTVVSFYTPACNCCFTRVCWPVVACWALNRRGCSCFASCTRSCCNSLGGSVAALYRKCCRRRTWRPALRKR